MKCFIKSFVIIIQLLLCFRCGFTQENHEAVRNGDLEKVKMLIAKDPSLLNLQDNFGSTPLHWAGIRERKEIFEFLINKGADINIPESHGGASLFTSDRRTTRRKKLYGDKKQQQPIPRSKYLGQIPPGLTPEIFAPGIISIEEKIDGNITFSPDLQEFYFSRRSIQGGDNRIFYSRLENGKLTVPVLASFSYDCLEEYPCLTPDGKRLYYSSKRPLSDGGTLSEELNIWFVDRTETGWSKPEFLGSPFNDYNPRYFSFDNNETLYFLRWEPREISYAELKGGRYSEIKRFTEEVNYLEGVHHPAIAPDGSYIIFDAFFKKDDGFAGGLHISFKKPDGSWSKAMSMDEIMKPPESSIYCNARITPDSKYIFFCKYMNETKKEDLYWVSSEIIEKLRPEKNAK